MVSIRVTQEIKDANPDLNLVLASVFVQQKIPSFFNGFEGYNYMTELHAFDGWVTFYPNPEYDRATQKIDRSQIIDIMDGETLVGHTYLVVDKTDEELQNDVLSQTQSQQELAIQQKLQQQVLNDAQAETDVETILNNQNLYPLWQVGIAVAIGEKYQHFGDNNEVWLWEVIQAHTTQSDRQPKDVPALFKRVAMADEYLAWKQPEGAHDAYNTGDVVWYPNVGDTLYESTVDANVWPPGVLAGQWIEFQGKK